MDSYFTKREITHPYTSGLYQKDLTLKEITEELSADLTEEEKRSPFAKYYYEPIPELQPQMKEAIENGPLSEEQMYMPNEAGPILVSGSKNYPLNGYGVLKNGVGYSTMLVKQDGITDEMIAAYRDHFAVTEDMKQRTLFYKTWYPGKHLIHFEDAIIEDFGWGFCLQDMNWELFNMEKHSGIKKEELPKLDPNCIAVMGVGGKCFAINNPEDCTETFMIQYLRDTDQGRELCIHYFYGLKMFADGRMEICPNVGREELTERMKGMMQHAMYECCNEIKHIKEFWNELQEH